MRSSTEQELFKQMSNRTRTRPQEIYLKMNTHISQLQDQVHSFNKSSEKMASRMQKYAKHNTSNKEAKLKSMTQPKYQELLMNCELPQNDKNNSKVSRMKRGVSTRTAKEFKTFGLNSSIGHLGGLKGIAQSKVIQSRIEESKLAQSHELAKNKMQIKSSMAQNANNSGKTSGVGNLSRNHQEANASMA